MFAVRLEIPDIGFDQIVMAFNDQEIFRVLQFRLPGEIETPGNKGSTIDDDDLVMGDRMVGIDLHFQPLFFQ